MRRTLSRPVDPGPFREDFDAIMERNPMPTRNEKPGMFASWRELAVAVGYWLLIAFVSYAFFATVLDLTRYLWTLV